MDFAAASIGVDVRTYFNSGVLLFDMAQPDTVVLLEEAIRLGEHELHRLFFLDQCALNIAFLGRMSPLPAEFNFFLNRTHPGRENARLLHFVASPKPWDISYEGEFRQYWVRYAEVTRLLMKAADYRHVATVANGGHRTAAAA